MNVISRRKLRDFYKAKPERVQHAGAFEDWFKLTRRAVWESFADVKALFGQTDVTSDTASGRTATIFDIGGNKYRIITLIDYMRRTVFVTHVLINKEYDKENWKADIYRDARMVAKATSKVLKRDAENYLSLVRRFSLRPLKNDEEHVRATEIVGELLGHKLDAGTGDYLDTLILLVNKYEDEQHTVTFDLTPQQAVRAIMEANGMKQKDLGKLLGSESSVSMFLKGDRELSKAQVKILAERFRVDPLLFF